MKHTFLVLTALACCLSPTAMAENQIWTSASVKTKPFTDDRIELSLNSDFRYQPDGDLDTIELRPGIGYKLSKRFKVSGGYLWSSARRSGPDRKEHRLWQQVSYDIVDALGGEFSGRSRLEQRQREGWDDTGLRLRQEFGFDRPIEGTPFELKLSTDLYFELNETDWGQTTGFTEARSEILIGWDLTDTLDMEVGYMNQFENEKGGPDNTNHHIVLGLSKRF
ncbi:DUF2490 domain-containing protein [Hyphomonas sp. WL0036]|uniref:DUF2490 domain-containing protein n=1 Tax=Hyphomonas sediminis TaxID=2866160 RepID=UPI001C807913|nr:DUF2490 domain-containing protein [Hyphomonas sediminis]MBY9068309.1 DUF2490 domain-containing protein [Hyphomonas sediminis]